MSALLQAEATHLLVVDVQERLLPAMAEPERVVANAARLIGAARRLGVPITVSEQYPSGIGATVAPLRETLGGEAFVAAKMSFSCLREPALAERVRSLAAQGRRQMLVCGIEAHVCVLQTALEAAALGLPVYVAADAIASRAPLSREIALKRMERAGVTPVTTEMAIFEWLGAAGGADFKALLPLLK
ncbi:MAG TPA: isochorismatase family protein [Beijerinckiaceae bacterium]|jgi:nicotinamidase-related amidase